MTRGRPASSSDCCWAMPSWLAATRALREVSITNTLVVSVNRMGCAARSRGRFGRLRAFSAQPSSEPGGHLSVHQGSPVTYAACATGLAWMYSWQGAQATKGFGPIRAISGAHAGWAGPRLPRLAGLG